MWHTLTKFTNIYSIQSPPPTRLLSVQAGPLVKTKISNLKKPFISKIPNKLQNRKQKSYRAILKTIGILLFSTIGTITSQEMKLSIKVFISVTKSTRNLILFVQWSTDLSKNVRAESRITVFSKTVYPFYFLLYNCISYHAKPQVSCAFQAVFRVDGVCGWKSIPIILASLRWSLLTRLNSVIQFTRQWVLDLSNWVCHLLSSITFYLIFHYSILWRKNCGMTKRYQKFFLKISICQYYQKYQIFMCIFFGSSFSLFILLEQFNIFLLTW